MEIVLDLMAWLLGSGFGMAAWQWLSLPALGDASPPTHDQVIPF